MRAFIAVRVAITPTLAVVMRELASMRPALKTVDSEQFHVTLTFLGDTDESVFADLSSALRDVAARSQVQEVTLFGLGAFPRIDRPSVVWAGFRHPALLVRLADDLSTRCEALGFAREARVFQPHLTLARVKAAPPEALAEFIRERFELDLGSVTIASVELFRSDLRSAGPRYSVLASTPLGAR